MGFIINPYGFGAAGASVVFRDSDFEVSNTSMTSHTLSFPDDLAADPQDRVLILTVTGIFDTSGALNTVTIDGASATKAIGSSSTSDTCISEIWYIEHPAGGGLSTILTFSANISRVVGTLHWFDNITSATPVDTDVQKATSVTARSVTVDHPAGGVTVVCAGLWDVGAPAGACTWTNITAETIDASTSGALYRTTSGYYTSGSDGTGRVFTPTYTDTGTIETVGASWR